MVKGDPMEEKKPKKILIIEDNEELVLSITTLLKPEGYHVLAAYDSLYGRNLAYKENVDLVILDLGLPAGGGFFVLENLKRSTKTNHIPVIIITAQQEEELKDKAFKMGAAAYLLKPFDPEELLKRIKEILK